MKGKIFNAQEMQAIIAGTKTMFREVIKPYPILSDDKSYWEFKGVQWAGKNSSYAKNFGDSARPEMPDLCPYQVGQNIFVKENFYLAWKKRPAQHMKQEHSRITLQITSIRVERLGGDISEENLPQGFRQIKDRNHFMYDTHIKRIPCNCGNSSPTLLSSVNIRTFLKESAYKFMCHECKKTPNKTYITSNGASCYWNDLIDPSWREKSESTHKKPEEKFEANPWVWVVDFKVNK